MNLDVSANSRLKEVIGQAIIDKIQERTQSNKSRTGSSFKRYSKSYKSSLDFKAAGKSSTVNLTLTGDMLNLMDITDDTGNTITIGWDESDEAAKAHGHITGNRRGPGVKRDFFGLPAGELDKIVNEFKSEIKEVKTSRGEKRAQAIEELIDRVEGSFSPGGFSDAES